MTTPNKFVCRCSESEPLPFVVLPISVGVVTKCKDWVFTENWSTKATFESVSAGVSYSLSKLFASQNLVVLLPGVLSLADDGDSPGASFNGRLPQRGCRGKKCSKAVAKQQAAMKRSAKAVVVVEAASLARCPLKATPPAKGAGKASVAPPPPRPKAKPS